jgi:hypothetical protein
VGLLALKNPQLLPQKQDLGILVKVWLAPQADEVQQQQKHLCQHKEEPGKRPCTEHAERRDRQRKRIVCREWERLWKASYAFSAPFGTCPLLCCPAPRGRFPGAGPVGKRQAAATPLCAGCLRKDRF